MVANDARLYQAFRDLDEAQTGKIKTETLKNKIKEMNPYGNVDMLLKVIDDVDLDNDGTIDYEEFLHALHPDFQETPNWFYSSDYKAKIVNKEEKVEDDDDEDIEIEQPVNNEDQDKFK